MKHDAAHHKAHEQHHRAHLFVEKAAAAHHPSAGGHGGEHGGEHGGTEGAHGAEGAAADDGHAAHAEADAHGEHGAAAKGTAAADDGAHGGGGQFGADLLDAAAVGVDIGGIMARRRNEGRLGLTVDEKKKKTAQGMGAVGIHGAAAVGGMAVGKGLEHLGVPGAGVVATGAAVAAAGAGTAHGDAKDRAKVAVAAGGGALILGGAHEAAAAGAGRALGHGELGFGVGAIAGRMAGAALIADGKHRASAMKTAAMEGGALVAVGAGMRAAFGAVAPVPLGVVNECKRKGLEFSGGHVLAFGKRNLSEQKAQQTAEGVETVVEMQRLEQGMQMRVGGGAVLMPVGAAMGGAVGAFAGSAVGGLFGIGGNYGKTQQSERRVDKAKGKKIKGFAGGFDVVGLQWVNLDTGSVRTCKIDIDEDGEYTLHEQRKYKILGWTAWKFSDDEYRQRLTKGKPVMVIVKGPDGALHCRIGEVTTSWKNCVSVKYGEGDSEVRRIFSRKSKSLCRPLLPVHDDTASEESAVEESSK